MSEIPPQNLPIYLQQYSVVVLCEKPKDNCFPLQQNPCVDTEFGCCSDGITPKTDPEGSNCPPECGSITYSTVGVIPSNVPKARVWNINLTGTLQKHDGDYVLYFDFSNVNYKEKDRIFFSKRISGTLNVCGRVLDASKNITYSQCTPNFRLYLTISQRKWDFRILKETLFSINIQLNDPDSVFAPVGCVMPAFFNYNSKDPYGAGGLQVGSGDNCSVIPNAMAAIWDSVFNGAQPPNFDPDSKYFAQDKDFFILPNMVGVCPASVPGNDVSFVNLSSKIKDINVLNDLTNFELNASNMPKHTHQYVRTTLGNTTGASTTGGAVLNCPRGDSNPNYNTSARTEGIVPSPTDDKKIISYLLPFYTIPYLLIYSQQPSEQVLKLETPVLLELPSSDTIYLSCIPTKNPDDYINNIGKDNWKQVIIPTDKNYSFWGQAEELLTEGDPRTSGYANLGSSSVTLTQENLVSHQHKYEKVKKFSDRDGWAAGFGCKFKRYIDNDADTSAFGADDPTFSFSVNESPYLSINSIFITNVNTMTLQLYEGMVILVDKSKFDNRKLPNGLIEFQGQSIESLPVSDCLKDQLKTNLGVNLPDFATFGSFPIGLDVSKSGGYCSDSTDVDFTKGSLCCYLKPNKQNKNDNPNSVIQLQQQILPLFDHTHTYDEYIGNTKNCGILGGGVNKDLTACKKSQENLTTTEETSETGNGKVFSVLQTCLGNLTLCLVFNPTSV